MNLSQKQYGEIMSTCVVIGDTLRFNGVSSDMLMDVYNRLSRDLFGMNIPHYRVIGFWHDYDDKHAQSVFRVNDIFGQSCIELSMQLRYLVPMENGGNDGALGCWHGVNEDMSEFAGYEDFKGFNRDWGLDNGKGGDNRTANILTLPRSVVGSLMIDTSHDDGPQKNEFTTSDVWYTQRMPYGVKFPEVLIPNKFISGIRDVTLGKAPTFMFIMEGTGTMSYMQTQELFNERCDRIMPCDVKWDLSEFFTIRIPDAGDTELRLTCLEKISDRVLQHILNEYGRRLAAE